MLVLTPNFLFAIFSFIYGIGQGSYISLGWSIAIDTIPKDSQNGQSLDLWQTARIAATLFSGTVSGSFRLFSELWSSNWSLESWIHHSLLIFHLLFCHRIICNLAH